MAGRGPGDIAHYVQAQTSEMARVCRDGGLSTLAYLLELAAMEAASQCSMPKSPSSKSSTP